MKSNLPPDFAMKLLDKEIELESNPIMMTLNELVDLYRLAIEYYEDIKSKKFWDMQDRLQKILMRPEILNIMREESNKHKFTKKSRPRAVTQRVSTSQDKRQQFEQNKKVFNTQLQDSGIVQVPNIDKQVTKLVENQESSIKETLTKSVNNLKNQDLSLEDRLKMRKIKNLNISSDSGFGKDLQTASSPINGNSTSSSFFFEFQDDKSNEEKSVNSSFMKSDELESLIERIMEENFIEKTEKVTEIKVKYEAQINEYSGQGSVYDDIVKQLKTKMNEEINEVVDRLDSKRKAAISKAKLDYIEIF
jgi:hypothetical protein